MTHRSGYVYLVASPSGHYKIGRTRDIHDRMRTFEVKLPFEPRLEHTIKTSDCVALETELHHRFEAKRVNGEWFALSPGDVQYIKSLRQG